jgi:hypothetical protein
MMKSIGFVIALVTTLSIAPFAHAQKAAAPSGDGFMSRLFSRSWSVSGSYEMVTQTTRSQHTGSLSTTGSGYAATVFTEGTIGKSERLVWDGGLTFNYFSVSGTVASNPFAPAGTVLTCGTGGKCSVDSFSIGPVAHFGFIIANLGGWAPQVRAGADVLVPVYTATTAAKMEQFSPLVHLLAGITARVPLKNGMSIPFSFDYGMRVVGDAGSRMILSAGFTF